MKRTGITLVLLVLLVGACLPTAPTPDAIATETVIAAKIFATLTAQASMWTPTPSPPTATPSPPPPTATDTATPLPPTDTPTSTPIPTNTPPPPAPTATPQPSPTDTPSSPTLTPTPVPLYQAIDVNNRADCNWTGIQGNIFNAEWTLMDGIQVKIWNEWGYAYTSPPSVNGFWEITLDGKPKEGTWYIQVVENGAVVSQPLQLRTSADCNVGPQRIQVNWKRTQ